MSRRCQISNRKANRAYSVSHSHVRTKRLQGINLQKKKVWSSARSKWIVMRISVKSMKNIYKLKLQLNQCQEKKK